MQQYLQHHWNATSHYNKQDRGNTEICEMFTLIKFIQKHWAAVYLFLAEVINQQ